MARTTGSSGEKTAEAISQTALRLFAERGYGSVSMRAIADGVGIQAGALYNYHATKQDVLLHLLVSHNEAVLEEWHKVREPLNNPVEELEAFVRFHIGFHLVRPDEVFISYMELRSLESDNFKKVERLRRSYEHDLKDILLRGHASGEFQIEDPHVAAMALLAMLTGLTTWYRPEGRLSVKKIKEIYLQLARQTVGLAPASTEKEKA